MENYQTPHQLQLYQTSTHACSYWPERSARDWVLEPESPRLPAAYLQALETGFRRSGNLLYRPHCQSCRACVAVRIPVSRFTPNRSQKRCLAKNSQVVSQFVEPRCTDEQWALYQRYLAARHHDGGMNEQTREEFEQFSVGNWVNAQFLEFREPSSSINKQGTLVALAVTDVLSDAYSAVYTFYAPENKDRGLGTLAILHQVQHAQQNQKNFLYLGYWIQHHPKMDYKRRFAPLEAFDGIHWWNMPHHQSP